MESFEEKEEGFCEQREIKIEMGKPNTEIADLSLWSSQTLD